MSGIFYFAANAIGRPEDTSPRALELLKTCDVVCFEEDKGARITLRQAGIHREYLKFTEHKEKIALSEIENALKNNQSVIYMSDQGASNLADPGHDLIKLANQCNAKMRIIPGPSSVTAALMACPFACKRFYFMGFLPREKEKRELELRNICHAISDPIVLLETPYRREAFLDSLQQVLKTTRRIFLAFDISCENEHYFTGTAQECVAMAKNLSKDLNFVCIVEGRKNI